MSAKLLCFAPYVLFLCLIENVYCGSTTLQGTLLCPDQNYCGAESTCCETKYSSYGCCPLYRANCCNNRLTCCPNGMMCLDHPPYCSNFSEVKPYKVKRSLDDEEQKPVEFLQLNIPAIPVVHLLESSINHALGNGSGNKCKLDTSGSCDDGENCCYDNPPGSFLVSYVGNGTHTFAGCCKGTCCNDFGTGKYFGCCPVTDGSCCVDKKHCCPKGYKCSSSGSSCIQENDDVANDDVTDDDDITTLHRMIEAPLQTTRLTQLTTSFDKRRDDVSKFIRYRNAASLVSKDDDDHVKCPNDSSFCQKDYTCCDGKNGKHLCCPHKNGQCCDDKKHCCAEGKTCDLLNNICS